MMKLESLQNDLHVIGPPICYSMAEFLNVTAEIYDATVTL